LCSEGEVFIWIRVYEEERLRKKKINKKILKKNNIKWEDREPGFILFEIVFLSSVVFCL